MLAESSPAAVLTIDSEFRVQAANRAAHQMLQFPAGKLVGEKIDPYISVFSDALKLSARYRPVRTTVTGWARRRDEQTFPIQAWLSVYGQDHEQYLAAIVVDMSEEVREREQEPRRLVRVPQPVPALRQQALQPGGWQGPRRPVQQQGPRQARRVPVPQGPVPGWRRPVDPAWPVLRRPHPIGLCRHRSGLMKADYAAVLRWRSGALP